MGDFNADGRDDIITFARSTLPTGQRGDIYVALPNGSSFGPSGSQWHETFCLGDELVALVINGDGNDDIVSFVCDSQRQDARRDVYVGLSTTIDANQLVVRVWSMIFTAQC